MTYEQFVHASDEELRQHATECFAQAYATGPLDRPAYLLEAQFCIGELERRQADVERRKHNRIAWRDLLLEIVVIVLIGWEIGLGIKQGSDEDALMDKQTKVLDDLNTNSSLTAATLKNLLSASQVQYDLDHRVLLNLDPQMGMYETLSITNLSPRNVRIAGRRIGVLPATFKREDELEIIPGHTANVRLPTLFQALSKRAPEGAANYRRSGAIPIELYLRSDDGTEWVAKYRLSGTIAANGVRDTRIELLSCTKQPWPRHP